MPLYTSRVTGPNEAYISLEACDANNNWMEINSDPFTIVDTSPPPNAPWGTEAYDRFEDIWSGVVAKHICDHLGMSVTVGPPVVEHARASDPFGNLVKEAPGVGVNEWLWESVAEVDLKGESPRECLLEMADTFRANHDKYFQNYGDALAVWVRRLPNNT